MVRVNAVGILPTVDMFGCKILFIKIKLAGFRSKFLIDGLVKFQSKGFMDFTTMFLVVEVSKCRSTDKMSVGH